MTAPIPPGPISGGQPYTYGAAPPTDPTAVMGRRFLAWMVDFAVFVALLVASFVAMAEYVSVGPIPDACDRLEADPAADIASCLDLRDMGVAEFEGRVYVTDDADAGVQMLIALGYFVFFVVLQAVTGASPGKLLAGIRVVDEQGRAPGFGKSLGRTLMWVVDGAPWIVPLVGPIVAVTNTGHRRVGDMAARTYVVSASAVGQPVPGTAGPVQGHPPPSFGASPPAWPGGPPSREPTPSPMPPPQRAEPSRPAVPEPELDIRSLDVPAPTDRVDEATPEVAPDPAWWDDADLRPEPPTRPGEWGDEPPDQLSGPPVAPTWEPPSSPGVEDPIHEWQPPTSPGVDEGPEPSTYPAHGAGEDEGGRGPEPAPFAPPGADPAASEPSEPAPRDPGVADPWGTGTGGTAGTGGGTMGPRSYELPPPQWDAARNTYIQWDPNRAAWLQWDTARERWKPIDT